MMLKHMKKYVGAFLAGVMFVTGAGSSTTYAAGFLDEGSKNTIGLYVQVVPQDTFMEETVEENTVGVPLHNDVIKSKFISKELENVLQIAAVDREKQKELELQQQIEKEKAAKEKAAKKAKKEAEKKAAEEKAAKEKKEKEEKIFCGYTNVGIADVADYVNIRKSPSSDSEKVGKLKGNAICQVIKKTEDGWYKIQSGDVKGYVSADYILVGQEAEDRALSLAVTKAEVNADVLVVRQKASKDSEAIAKVAQGYKFDVVEEKTKGDWVAVSYKETTGYVFAEFVDLKETTLSTAEAIQQRQVERAQEQKQEREVANHITQNNNFKKEEFNTKKLKDSEATETQKEVVEYAMKFLGNPYVWGGTSLTKGADCSGFTQSVYAHFGYYLNRTSRDQAKNGTPVDLEDIQPGDLLFYSYGGVIGHVAIYAGDNKIVHASTEETGIIVSDAFRNTPCRAVRILEEDEVEVQVLDLNSDNDTSDKKIADKNASNKKVSSKASSKKQDSEEALEKEKTKKKSKKETKKKTKEQAKTEEKDEEKDK